MKIIVIEDIGEVTIRKSARAKRISLKISADGSPVAVIPSFVPYKVAEMFIQKNKSWIQENQPETAASVLHEGTAIGRSHTICFVKTTASTTTSRIVGNTIRISHPQNTQYSDQAVQKEAKKAAIRALKKQAEAYLPSQLYQLANRHGYSYSQVRIKTSSTRWGSCSSNRIINLSVWLMQLPDDLIQYVILHELTHLNHMNHSPAFWAELESLLPDYKQRKKSLKHYRPALILA